MTPDLYTLSYWVKYGHAESAAVHTAARLGLPDVLRSDPGLTDEGLAERTGCTPHAARVLRNVLRLGGAPPDPEALEEVRTRANVAAKRWPVVGDMVTALRAGDHAELSSCYRDLPPPGGNWLLDRADHGYLRARVLSAAAEVGLLAALVDGRTPDLAARLDLPAPSLAVLTDALTRLGVMRHGTHDLAPSLREALSAPRALRTYLLGAQLAHRFWDALGDLDDVARGGGPTFDLLDPDVAGRYYHDLAAYNGLVFPGYFTLARRVVRAVIETRTRPGLVLDVGAGSGVWGAAFAHTWPGSRVRFFDRAAVLVQTGSTVARLGIADRAELVTADLTTDAFGAGEADVLVLGQICHTQPASALPELLARCRAALRPDGILVLADQVLDDTTLQPSDYVPFAVKELVSTGGSVLYAREYRELLADAGFAASRCFRFPGLDVFLAGNAELPSTVDGAAPEVTV
ncbi:methyltransferase [Saccharothrix sp. NRRL B-16314]|uniref:methyltransferase n=1 Tax=Saccharothrix sp. NRRL B-16314 TaxID=1463825 RepID=UPI000526B721|nr:methyltransferase [Saccharothrix sp. NRRL B-16314]